MPSTFVHAYLHGFASSALSRKGLMLAERLQPHGVSLQRPDLNNPSFEALTYSGALGAVDAMDAAHGAGARWHLIGSSMGGYIAARWAQLHPERVASLILLCPGFEMHTRWPKLLGAEVVERWRRDGSLTLPGPDGQPASIDWGFMRDAQSHPPTPVTPCRTLIIHGQRDETVPVETSRTYARVHSHVELVEVDDDHRLLNSVDLIAQRCLDVWSAQPT